MKVCLGGLVARTAATAAVLLAIGCGGEDPASAASVTSGATSGGSGGSGGGAPGACPGTSTAGAGGGDGWTCNESGSRWITRVASSCFGAGENFGHATFPENVYGPPKGGGCCAGSLDVCSLGNGGTITVAFDVAIVDGPGVDFLVFENSFYEGGDPMDPFAEIATVEVSPDGLTWTAFPCTATSYPYGSCAGWHPVFGNPDMGVDPLDPAAAGGDPFDLADVGVPFARFVRITDRADMPGSFDLDAVGVVNAGCP